VKPEWTVAEDDNPWFSVVDCSGRCQTVVNRSRLFHSSWQSVANGALDTFAAPACARGRAGDLNMNVEQQEQCCIGCASSRR
jgi:hypothetical protein